MFLTCELSGRLGAYNIAPRIEPPVNRAPIARIQPRATQAEASERDTIPFASGWVHPVVYGCMHISVVEARGLIASSYSYDPIQQLLVRGNVPTVGFPSGTPKSNTFAEIELEHIRERTNTIPATLEPVWNQNFTLFPVREARSVITINVLHTDFLNVDPYMAEEAPVFLGRVRLSMPLDETTVDRWYQLSGRVPGQSTQGLIRVICRYEAINYARVNSGSSVRVGGILLRDIDARNNTLRVTLTATYGNLSLPSNLRIAYLVGDPLAREDPMLAYSFRFPRYNSFAEPPARIGFREGDGKMARRMVIEGSMQDLSAALSELEYVAPFVAAEDDVFVRVNDLGHTGSGGAKEGLCRILFSVFEGTDNLAPTFRMWPEGSGLPVLPESGTTVTRTVPMGLEAALHGLQIDDPDSFDGQIRVCAVVDLGLISVHGLGPWSRGNAAERAYRKGLEDASEITVEGRQITTMRERGAYTRNLICVTPGGFGDEYQVRDVKAPSPSLRSRYCL